MKNKNPFFTTELATAYWLHSMGIENYTIHDNLTVDVDGSVWINNKNLDCIPVQFGEVIGEFHCYNNKLQSLKGSPSVVEGNFNCSDNKLKSLEYAPTTVMDSFSCDNNQLNTLDFMTKNIDGNLWCYNNPITDFSHFEFEVKGDIIFTPPQNMDYLNSYKITLGNVEIDYNEFKKLQALQKLNEKLDNDLSIKPVKIKHKI